MQPPRGYTACLFLTLAFLVCGFGLASPCDALTILQDQTDLDELPRLQLSPEHQTWLDAHPVIRMAPDRNYAPAQFIDEQGRHRGIAAEYVAMIEYMLGISMTVEIVPTWQAILDGTRNREIDVIALAAETGDRTSYLTFSRPYLDLPAVIIARVDVDQLIKPDDLEGMHVCVVGGYAVQDYLEEKYPQITLDEVDSTRAGLRKVSLGMADAFISDLAVASHFIREEGITNLRIVGETGYIYTMGFGVRSDWPELVEMIDLALQQIPEQRGREIVDSWIGLSRDTEFASQRLLQTLSLIAGIVLLAAIAFLVWNRSLQRRVNLKTRQLNEELIERQRVAEALKTSEERVRLIITTALDAVITMNADGLVTGWSPQAEHMFGWQRDEIINQSLAETIVPEQHRDAHRAGLARHRSSGEGPVLNTRIEITAMHRDGREFPIELAISPIPNQQDTEYSAFVRDITQRRAAEDELKQHREHLEELVVERTTEMRAARDVAEAAQRELAQRVDELELALAEVKQLRGLLPICSYCKRIREGEDYARSVEAYLADHTDAQFSHGVCPDCYRKYVEPDLDDL